MKDRHTRKLERKDAGPNKFQARFRASLVVLAGEAEGTEHILEAESVSLGRGPGVDIGFPDDAMSRQHASLELTGEGYRIRDLASTNGVLVNGSVTRAADLKHGDKIALGEHTLQYVIELRKRVATYDLS